MGTRRSKRRFGLLIGSAVLLVISSLVAFALAEYGFRTIKEWKWRSEASDWTNEFFKPLPGSPLEYELYPGVTRENRIPETGSTWHYRINADGFRGEDFSPDKDRKRVLFLGDSYTFGWAVDQDEVLSESVRRVLAEPPYNLDIHAYNIGVPGYNTFQEYHLLNQVLDRYAPDLVVLGYVLNDAEPQQSVPESLSVRYKYVTSWMFAYLKEQINHYIFDGKPVLSTGVVDVSEDYLLAMQKNGPAWVESRKAFADMVTLCHKQDIPFVLLIYPDYTVTFDDKYPYQAIHDEVFGWAGKSGVRTVDLLNFMRGKDARNYRVRGDGHPNGRAFAEAAQALAPVLYEALEDSPP